MKKAPLVALLDLGGCEGCALSFLRATSLQNICTEVSSHLFPGDQRWEGAEIIFVCGSSCAQHPEGVEELKAARDKGGLLIAFGSCATFGGVTRFARGGQSPRPEQFSYLPVCQVVTADFALPGCPPPPTAVVSLLRHLTDQGSRRLEVFRALTKVPKLSGFDLIDDVVLSGLCMGCGACEISCPTGAMRLIDNKPDLLPEKCIRCGTCYVHCSRGMQVLLKGVNYQKIRAKNELPPEKKEASGSRD